MRLIFVALCLGLAACGQTTPATTASTTTSSATAAATTTGTTSGAEAASVWDPTSARSWDRHLLALMPQIDACIAQQPEAREVTYAGERNGGVFVRLRSPHNNFDCGVRDGAASISPRDDALNVDGENAAIFIRGPGENPGGECYQAPEVHDASGNVLGWMIDPQGC
jgi:hypothetical protein